MSFVRQLIRQMRRVNLPLINPFCASLADAVGMPLSYWHNIY